MYKTQRSLVSLSSVHRKQRNNIVTYRFTDVHGLEFRVRVSGLKQHYYHLCRVVLVSVKLTLSNVAMLAHAAH